MRIERRVAAAVAVAVAVAPLAAACEPPSGTKAGGDAVTTLTMADGYADPGLEPAVAAFVAGVRQRSGGRLRIQVTRQVGDFAPDFEQRVVRSVGSGRFDLGWSGTRVLDTLGVTGFRALSAPLLIDSYRLQTAVFRAGVPAAMLPSVRPLGVTGLAVLAGSLRKPVAVAKPLLGPADWRGITFSAVRSTVQAATIRALGATPVDVVTTRLDDGLQRGRIDGYEKNLRIYAANNGEATAPYVTADVNLWPETAVLLAGTQMLGRLAPVQRGWLQAAAAEAAARSTGLADDDQSLVAGRCERGTRFATASPGDLAALRAAVAPVWADLRRDPATARAVQQILELKATAGGPSSVVVPAGCAAGDRPVPPATRRSGSLAARLVGSWRTPPVPPERIAATFRRAGGTAAEAADFVVQLGARSTEQFGLEVTAGTWREVEVSDGGEPSTGWAGSYTVTGSTVHAVGSGGCAIDYRAVLTGDQLTLVVLADVGPEPGCGTPDLPPQRAVYESSPFVRVR